MGDTLSQSDIDKLLSETALSGAPGGSETMTEPHAGRTGASGGAGNIPPGSAPGPSDSDSNSKPPAHGLDPRLDRLLDLPLQVSVEVGRTRILVQDLLKLHKGSVVELSKLATEPLRVLVNGRHVADGEVVVVNDHFGVRLRNVADFARRIRALGA